MRVLLDNCVPRTLIPHLPGHDVATVVLVARTNRVVDLLPLMPRLLEVLPELRPGQVTHVGG